MNINEETVFISSINWIQKPGAAQWNIKRSELSKVSLYVSPQRHELLIDRHTLPAGRMNWRGASREREPCRPRGHPPDLSPLFPQQFSHQLVILFLLYSFWLNMKGYSFHSFKESLYCAGMQLLAGAHNMTLKKKASSMDTSIPTSGWGRWTGGLGCGGADFLWKHLKWLRWRLASWGSLRINVSVSFNKKLLLTVSWAGKHTNEAQNTACFPEPDCAAQLQQHVS